MARLIKRFIDIFVSLLLLFLLSPLMLLAFLVVGFKLGCPVIFKQARPGLNGNVFYLIKFRTMLNQNEEQSLTDEERITKFGSILRAASVDELPSLLNVLKGDMSLVGPRPLLVEYLPLYNEEQARRHLVRPGITGWAQVNGRNAISWEDKFKLDVWYVDNQSLLLDIKILFLTVKKVFVREGISAEGHVTMEKFKGSKE